jgi:hypothetical protein
MRRIGVTDPEVDENAPMRIWDGAEIEIDYDWNAECCFAEPLEFATRWKQELVFQMLCRSLPEQDWAVWGIGNQVVGWLCSGESVMPL